MHLFYLLLSGSNVLNFLPRPISTEIEGMEGKVL